VKLQTKRKKNSHYFAKTVKNFFDRKIGPRSSVWSEAALIEASEQEFSQVFFLFFFYHPIILASYLRNI
jgi:hypothetical protein